MSKRYEVIPSPSFEKELEDIFAWIAKQSPQAATNWYNSCLNAIYSLEAVPQRRAVAPENEDFEIEIRQLIHGNYRILFTIQDDAVHVLHVRHGARDYMRPDDPETIDDLS